MSEAKNFFKSLQKNPFKIQSELRKIFKNPALKIKEIALLRNRLIINNRYKSTILANLENNSPQKIVFEVHDDLDCFKKNVFALENLSDVINPPRCFAKIDKPKIIVREHLEGKFIYELIIERVVPFYKITEINERAAEMLIFLHSLKIKNLPRFLFKKINRKIERKILKTTIQFLTPEIWSFKKRVEIILKELFKKLDELDNKNRVSLIHGDAHPAHFLLGEQVVRSFDFDTLEVGNPGRDLGRYIFHLKKLMMEDTKKTYSLEEFEKIKNAFLGKYLRAKKINLKPDIEKNLNVYQAQMVQYTILSKLWGKKHLDKRRIEEIKNLLTEQEKLLNL